MLWILLTLGCTGSPEPAAHTVPARRQPIVLITLDTARADRLGCYGHAAAETPNLDALAERGHRFTRALAPVPLTIPSHCTLFTGLLPPHHGVRDNGDHRLSEHAHTLAEHLQDRGWHTRAAVGAFVTQASWGFGQGFDGYADDLGVPSDRLSWRAERSADQVVDDGIIALNAGAGFLWVHLFDAHAPYQPPAPFDALADPYDGELAFVDQQVGRLLDAAPGDSIVVVAGDHGEALGEGGEREHGLLLHDATLRVPLIVAGPGVPVGVTERPVSLADVSPTLLRLAGVDTEDSFDGIDLFGIDPSAPTARAAVWSETLYGKHHYGWTPLYAVTTDRGRLVRGARDEGGASPEAVALLDHLSQAQPRWEAPVHTLDEVELEQLQALGYVAGPSAPTATGVDPRDGIAGAQQLQALATVPPVEREAALRALLVQWPQMRDARLRLAMMLAARGEVEAGINELTAAWREQPDSTGAAVLGRLWLQVGEAHEALSWFGEARARDPRAVTALAGEVEALARLGRLEEARVLAQEGLAIHPDHAALLRARAVLALSAGEPTEPFAAPLAALAIERPQEAGLLLLAASLQQGAGRPEEAVELLRTELTWRPWHTAARLELARVFAETGRHVDVVKTLRPLVAIEPDEPRWHALSAQAYLAMGRPDLAAPHQARCAGLAGCP